MKFKKGDEVLIVSNYNGLRVGQTTTIIDVYNGEYAHPYLSSEHTLFGDKHCVSINENIGDLDSTREFTHPTVRQLASIAAMQGILGNNSCDALSKSETIDLSIEYADLLIERLGDVE